MNKQELIAALEALPAMAVSHSYDHAVSRKQTLALARQLDEPEAKAEVVEGGQTQVSAEMLNAVSAAIPFIESAIYGAWPDERLVDFNWLMRLKSAMQAARKDTTA